MGTSPAAWAAAEGENSENSVPLPHSGETLLAELSPVLDPSEQERFGAAEAGPEEATELFQGLEPFCLETG